MRSHRISTLVIIRCTTSLACGTCGCLVLVVITYWLSLGALPAQLLGFLGVLLQEVWRWCEVEVTQVCNAMCIDMPSYILWARVSSCQDGQKESWHICTRGLVMLSVMPTTTVLQNRSADCLLGLSNDRGILQLGGRWCPGYRRAFGTLHTADLPGLSLQSKSRLVCTCAMDMPVVMHQCGPNVEPGRLADQLVEFLYLL